MQDKVYRLEQFLLLLRRYTTVPFSFDYTGVKECLLYEIDKNQGFCWIDVNSTYIKARIKANGVFDVLSMSLFTITNLPDWYYVALINSEFISLYVDNFINNTSHFQINDTRQLPIIIPKKETFESLQKK